MRFNSPGHSVRYVVTPQAEGTTVFAASSKTGDTVWQRTLQGRYGTTMLTQSGLHGGLSRDGSLLVLASFSSNQPAAETTFAAMRARMPSSNRTC